MITLRIHRFSTLTLRKAALAGAAAMAITSGAAMAQGAGAAVVVDIEAQDLSTALSEFGRQTNTEIIFTPTVVRSKKTSSLRGEMSRTEALDALLAESGLVYETTASNVIYVKAAAGGAAQRDGAQLNVTERPTPNAGDPSAEPGSVTGGVKDERTGANLKGALIEIAETGQTTSTDDLGNFRFPSVRPGRYTLRISYLGFRDATATIEVRSGQRFDQSFALIGGDGEDVIMVYGNRSARAQSLNQERTAANSTTVLAADMLGNFNGTTISEALRRAPGVAFEPNPETGEGANVILRGLEPDLNQVQLNGLRLLDGSAAGRSSDLSSILTESVESVTISKSLLPSQDSNGAGGLIEIETKSPLDRDRRFASFGVEYGENGNDFGNEFGLNGTVSGAFGTRDDIGLSLSASYRESETTRIDYRSTVTSILGQYLPLDENGAPITRLSAIDPRRTFPFEEGADEIYPRNTSTTQGDVETELLSLTGAVQKQFGDHTDLRLDVTYSKRTETSFNTSTSVAPDPRYDLSPIAELGGEVRGALISEDIYRSNPFFQSLFGTGIPGTLRRSASYNPDKESDSIGISFRGQSDVKQWSFNYNAGYTRSTNHDGESYSLSLGAESLPGGAFGELVTRDMLTPEALNNVTGDGRLVSVFAPLTPGGSNSFVLPLFNEDGFAFYNTLDALRLSSVRVTEPRDSESDALTLEGSARYSFDKSPLRYLEVGLNFQDTSFSRSNDLNNVLYRPGETFAPLSTFGLEFGPGLLTQVGADADFDSLTRGGVEAFTATVGDLISSDELLVVFADDVGTTNRLSTTETTFAGYVEGQVDIGKLELIGGLRVEQYEIESTSFAAPRVFGEDGAAIPSVTDLGEFITESVSQTDILPRVLANYRFTDNFLARAGYFTTVTRPQLQNLTDRAQFNLFLAPTPDRLFAFIGNPELEPAVTHNFSIDWEWYSDAVGVFKVGAFYKLIENPLQRTSIEGGLEILPADLSLPDISFFNDLTEETDVRVTRPVNGEDSDKIWGIETTAEKQLTFLPGLLSGLGIYTNYTYTDSSSTRQLSTTFVPEGFVEITGVPFDRSPRHSGTVGLTYNKYNIDASLYYTAQARRLTSFKPYFVHDYAEAYESLDFRADYFLDVRDSKLRLFVRGENLLEGKNDPRLETSIGGNNGVPIYFTGGTYFGGRSFFFGASATF